MEAFLSSLLENSSLPFLSALLLGLMTAISPCPLATNITAIGFIGKDLENRNKVFYNGLVYTLGRAITYTGIAFIIFLGADKFQISGLFQKYGEKIIGPLLILIGLFMLDVIRINFPGLSGLTKRFESKGTKNLLRCVVAGNTVCRSILPLQRSVVFRDAGSFDHWQRFRVISACNFCHCHRDSCNHFRLASGLFSFTGRQLI